MKTSFLDLDIRFLRSICSSSSWAPPETLQPFIAPADAIEIEPDEITSPDNQAPCGFVAPSRKALDTHQRFAKKPGHGIRQLLWMLNLSNVCIVCLTPFKDRKQVCTHLTRSWYVGRCVSANTKSVYKPCFPDVLDCPLCSKSFGSFEELRLHLVSHIPQTLF